MEQENGHTVHVGYQKGAAQAGLDFVFSIQTPYAATGMDIHNNNLRAVSLFIC